MSDFNPTALPSLSSASIKRILITLAALFLYRLGAVIPLPGIDISALGNGSGALERVSILALGILPWVYAAVLGETVNLLSPRSWKLPFVRDGHADPFSIWVIGSALILAASQAYGVVIALEFSPLVSLPGIAFQATAIASLIGGTALVIALAGFISRYGVGFGFWVLFACAQLLGISGDVIYIAQYINQGFVAPVTVMMLAIPATGALAAFVALFLNRSKIGLGSVEPLIWPVLILTIVVNPLLYATLQSFAEDQTIVAVLGLNHPIGASFAFVILLLMTMRYGAGQGQFIVSTAEAAMLWATMVLSDVAWRHFNINFSALGLIVLVGVSMMILRSLADQSSGLNNRL